MRIFELWFWRRYWFIFVILTALFYFFIGLSIKTFLIPLLLIWIYSLIKSFLRRKIPSYRRFKYKPHLRKKFLSRGIKSKAHLDFKKELHKFKNKHNGKKPTRNDIYRIAINSSHRTLKTRGAKGHWGRQKIRKILLEKHQVVKKYKMH